MKNLPINFNNLKSKVDKLGADKLLSVPVDLSKLSNFVKNVVVKKDVYNGNIKILKIKYLILRTWLLQIILMLK